MNENRSTDRSELGQTEAVHPVRADPTPVTDPALAEILAAWPELPLAMRFGIAAMVRAGKGNASAK